jgi:hypothetical protein
VVSFQITVLKVLAGHPEGRASIADLTRYVSILISSGTDWTNRTKRLAARAPKLDIFADSLVLRDDNGWHITEGGRQFLASLEAPLPIATEPVQAPQADTTKQPRSPALPRLRLVVNNDKQPPGGRQRPNPKHGQLITARPDSTSQVTKNYAVGLENSCPGGAYHWAPEIPQR